MTSFKSKLGLILFGWSLLHPTAFASEQRLRGLGIGLQTKDPTEAPVPAPVTAPVPVPAPVTGVVVPAPVTAPVAAPVTAPVAAPVTGVVVPAPATAPVPAPATAPAPVTVAVPTPAPVADVPVVVPEPDLCSSGSTIATLASQTGDLSILVQLLIRLNLVELLGGNAQFTVFAPTNAAFADAFDINNIGDVDDAELRDFVLYHVVPGSPIMAADIKYGMVAKTAAGAGCEYVVFNVTDTGDVFVNDAKVIAPDVKACNGVVHLIDRVLYAPDLVDH